LQVDAYPEAEPDNELAFAEILGAVDSCRIGTDEKARRRSDWEVSTEPGTELHERASIDPATVSEDEPWAPLEEEPRLALGQPRHELHERSDRNQRQVIAASGEARVREIAAERERRSHEVPNPS